MKTLETIVNYCETVKNSTFESMGEIKTPSIEESISYILSVNLSDKN